MMTNDDERGGRGVKNAQNLMTSYVNDPLACIYEPLVPISCNFPPGKLLKSFLQCINTIARPHKGLAHPKTFLPNMKAKQQSRFRLCAATKTRVRRILVADKKSSV